MNNKKKLLSIVVFIILLFGLVIYFLLNRLGTTELQTQKLAPIENSTRYDESSIVFSNGRTFIKYDVLSGETKKLFPESKLPSEITDLQISDDKHYIVFKARRHSFDDSLGQKLINENQPDFTPRWWVGDLTTKSFKYLEDGVIAATIDNTSNQVISLMPSTSSFGDEGNVGQPSTFSTLSFKDPVSLTEIKSLESQPFVNINIAGERLIGQLRDLSLHEINVTNGDSTQILEKVASASLSSDGNFVAFTSIEDNETQISVYDFSNQKAKEIGFLPEESFNICWLNSSNGLLFPSKGKEILRYNAPAGKVDQKFKTISSEISELSVQECLDNNLVVVKEGQESTHLAYGENLKPDPPLSGFENYSIKTSSNSLVEYSDKARGFLVSIEGSVNEQKKQEVYDKLLNDGINPDLWNISFIESGYDKSFSP